MATPQCLVGSRRCVWENLCYIGRALFVVSGENHETDLYTQRGTWYNLDSKETLLLTVRRLSPAHTLETRRNDPGRTVQRSCFPECSVLTDVSGPGIKLTAGCLLLRDWRTFGTSSYPVVLNPDDTHVRNFLKNAPKIGIYCFWGRVQAFSF